MLYFLEILLVLAIIDSIVNVRSTLKRRRKMNFLMMQLEETGIDRKSGIEFEYWCAGLLRKNGFTHVDVTPGSNDQGVDILAEKGGQKYAFQCKRYGTPLGNKPVQEVYTGMAIYHCQAGVVMTNNYFTKGAKKAAAMTGVQLWDRNTIAVLWNTAIQEERKAQKEIRKKSAETYDNQFKDAPAFPLSRVYACAAIILVILGIAYFLIPHFVSKTGEPTQAVNVAQSGPDLSLKEMMPHDAITTLEELSFGQSQSDVRQVLSKYDIDLHTEDGQSAPECYIQCIMSPEAYPASDTGWNICLNEYGYPDALYYFDQRVAVIRLYYCRDVENENQSDPDDQSMLYAVKMIVLSESPESTFETIQSSIKRDCGSMLWQGTDTSEIIKVDKAEESGNERKYCVWRLSNGTLITISKAVNAQQDKSHVEEIEISLTVQQANDIINRAVELEMKKTAAQKT